MRLPNGENAFIDRRKLINYSLNEDHDDGRHKAHLFKALLGISAKEDTILFDGLLRAAKEEEAIPGRIDKYGQRFQIDFALTGPTGTAMIRSAWIVRSNEGIPRLVSCFVL